MSGAIIVMVQVASRSLRSAPVPLLQHLGANYATDGAIRRPGGLVKVASTGVGGCSCPAQTVASTKWWSHGVSQMGKMEVGAI